MQDERNNPSEPFRITDDKLADWAMRKIAQARQDTQMWEEHFQKQMEAIRKRNEETAAYFTACLHAYFETVPVHKTDTQAKYTLPSGTLVRKKQAPLYNRDDEALAAFLTSSGLACYVETKTYPKWAELKRNCVMQPDGTIVEASTGLVVEGITAQARPDKFEVKLNGDDGGV